MGIAITTRFQGPTNTRGSRYVASAGGKPGGGSDRLSRSANQSTSPVRNRAAVARALAERLEWHGLWIAGGLNGTDIVYVRAPVGADAARAMAEQMDINFVGEDWFYLPDPREPEAGR